MTLEELKNKHIIETMERLKQDAEFMALPKMQQWAKLTLEFGVNDVSLRKTFKKLNIEF